MSPVLNLLKDVPDGSPAPGAPLSALATVLVICGLTLKASGYASTMGFLCIGVLAGSLVAVFFGIYDTARVAEASPGLVCPRSNGRASISASERHFWTLLPGFLLAATDRRHPDDQQRRRRSARLLAPAPGSGFPGGAGRGGHRRPEQPALRPRGNDGEHVLYDGRIPGPAHRRREPATSGSPQAVCSRRWRFCRRRSPWCWRYRGRSSPPISS